MQPDTTGRSWTSSLAPGMRGHSLGPDLLAGATLAAVAIPEGLGYAKIAGMPPEAGLYTCLLPVLAFALFASTRRLVIGADSATAAISASAVGLLAVGDPARFVALSSALALMTGLLLLLAGRLRLGFLSDFMSRSVLAGFLTGVGIQIAVGQLDGMLGVDGSGESTWEKFITTIGNALQANGWDIAISAGVVAVILGLARWAPRVPGPLVAVAGSMALAAAAGLADKGVAMVGALPAGLPALGLPTVRLADLVALMPTAMILLLVQVAQSVSTASAFAIAHDDVHDPNRDLMGLGAANVAAGVSSTFVVNGSPTKTAISDQSGTRSQLAMVVLALLTVPVLIFLTDIFRYLPEAALAAVVFVIAVHLIKWETLRMLRRLPTSGEFWVAASTAAFVALVGVGGGILWAILASIAVHIGHTSRPHNRVLAIDANGRRTELPVAPGVQTAPGLIVYRFAANLYYANAARLVADVRELVQTAGSPLRVFVLDASEIQDLDWTSAESLRRAVQLVQSSGAQFLVARLPADSRKLLDYFGLTELIGEAGYVERVQEVLQAFGRGDGRDAVDGRASH